MLALEREEKQAEKSASEAVEIKEKQAEKAAADARAQKEAKKKRKVNKKYMKCRTCSAEREWVTMGPFEQLIMELELEEATEDADAPLAGEAEEPNENVRYRKPKGRAEVPKFIPTDKKSPPYWMWTALEALAAVLILALGYYLAFVRK